MTKVTSEQNPPLAPWYESAFGADYLKIYGHRSPEAAVSEALWLKESLGLSQGDLVLDCACGNGRHVAALRSLGIPTIGADLSRELLSTSPYLFGSLPLVRHDVRALPFLAKSFTHAMLLFTSFGYFQTDHEQLSALVEIARVLAPRGVFVLDFLNAPRTIEELIPRTVRTVGNTTITECREFHKETGRINKSIELVTSGSTIEPPIRNYLESVRAYSETELRELLEKSGFQIESSHGDFEGALYSASSPRLILIARLR